jgi:hypothetical protein
MKTQLIAALMIAGSVIAAPAFAGNNSADAPFPSFTSASTTTRAEVKSELVAAVDTKNVAPQGNHVDPSVAAVSRQAQQVRQPALAQDESQLNRERP